MSHPKDHSKPSRRELSRRVRNAFPSMGIYRIRDKETGQVTVASSRNVQAAINRATFELRMRSHADKAVQAAWDQGGPERIDFEVLDILRERDDPDFDYSAELCMLEDLYREEFSQQKSEHHGECPASTDLRGNAASKNTE